MKLKQVLLALAVFAAVTVGTAQSKRNLAAKEFMRDKLQLSQQILEGLAMENFDLINAKATRLSAMSKQADWRVFENPEYDQQSVTFRRHVDALARAAREKNIDAATLAYVRITMSCVDCHKLVRGRLVTSLDQPAEPPGRSGALPSPFQSGGSSPVRASAATITGEDLPSLPPPALKRQALVRLAQPRTPS